MQCTATHRGYNATADALVDFMEKNNLPIPTEELWAKILNVTKKISSETQSFDQSFGNVEDSSE